NTFLSSLANLGNDFLSVFTSFGEMTGTVLGFNTETKKSDVAAYFKKIHDTVQGTKDKLNTIVENMKREGNHNAAATETAVTTLSEKLTKIIQGAKTASDALKDVPASEPIANVAAKTKGGDAGSEVASLVKGIKSIVDVVLENVGNHEAGTDKKASDLSARKGGSIQTNGEAGNLFASSASSGVGTSDTHAKGAAADVLKAVGAVTGADILKAIVTNGEATATKAAEANATDATIAGAIALRAMTKSGKFPGVNTGVTTAETDYTAGVRVSVISAVTKALNTLTVAMKNTIDAGLKAVKEAMKINPNDNPVAFEANTVAK
ncbi:variable large family protein, partial [Borrelia coriaceae]